MAADSAQDQPAQWMQEAIALARSAEAEGEVPVGAVVIIDGEVVGRGYNRVIGAKDPTAHAEVVAMRDAAARIGNYRLTGAILVSTIEPCSMCAGAMVHARVKQLFYGAKEPRSGAAGSTINVFENPALNHRVSVTGGICEEQTSTMMSAFFKARRES